MENGDVNAPACGPSSPKCAIVFSWTLTRMQPAPRLPSSMRSAVDAPSADTDTMQPCTQIWPDAALCPASSAIKSFFACAAIPFAAPAPFTACELPTRERQVSRHRHRHRHRGRRRFGHSFRFVCALNVWEYLTPFCTCIRILQMNKWFNACMQASMMTVDGSPFSVTTPIPLPCCPPPSSPSFFLARCAPLRRTPRPARRSPRNAHCSPGGSTSVGCGTSQWASSC